MLVMNNLYLCVKQNFNQDDDFKSGFVGIVSC